MLFALIFISYLHLYHCGSISGLRNPRIVNGKRASPNEFPFVVSIVLKSSQSVVCGGSIYNNMTIITAAHCVMDEMSPPFSLLHFVFSPTPTYSVKSPKEFLVVAGEHTLDKWDGKEQVRNTSKVIIHPNYKGHREAYDIALLRLEKPLEFNTNVKAVSLPPKGFVPLGFGVIVGWGAASFGEKANVLRKGRIPIVPEPICKLAYSDFRIFSNICAGGTTQDTCFGDSGGPLLCSDPPVLCGVTSYGSGCGRLLRPGAYTKVTYFNDWIVQNAFHQNA